MSLSIIIPCLNEADGIAAALEALRPFRRRGAQIIVVDGGSGDDTIARAQGGADHVLTARCGRALQMNAGAAHARGDILLFLHADCTLPDAADELIIDGLRRERKSWGRFDVRIRGRPRLLCAVAASMNARSRLTGIATGDQGMFVTRALFDAVGHFPEIALMEDVELSRRLKHYGRPLCLRHHVSVSARRWETHGVLRTILLMWKLRLAYRLGADPDRLALQYAARKR
jgi:rSAM/selenodomain-associated transferase 2